MNDFDVFCFDISSDGLEKTKAWATKLDLKFNYQEGDMLNLPYKDNVFDNIICYNVISHSDTIGVKKIISEIKRVLKSGGECFITLCSKETWGYKQDWPKVDQNTKLRMEEGPEYKVPHFYADYDLIKELFKDFEIISLRHVEEIYEKNNGTTSSWHYHILIKNKKTN